MGKLEQVFWATGGVLLFVALLGAAFIATLFNPMDESEESRY